MSVLRQAARRIRHWPGLDRADALWRVVRPVYRRVLDASGTGVCVKVGGSIAVRMPAEFAGGDWEQYEAETFARYGEWLGRHADGLVLDVGSSVGVFSAAALFAQPAVDVIAFESDLASLAAVRRMCRHATGGRLRLVHGFIGEACTEAVALTTAVAATERALEAWDSRGEAGATRFVCLDQPGIEDIPNRRLDDLFAGERVERRPMLIKCDVEGAELLVLYGARSLLQRARPELLLSVHPFALPQYGHTVEAVRAFLECQGYGIRCIAVDHEEHWWCVPVAKMTGAA